MLAERYELRTLLGRGGHAEVWLANDPRLGIQRAVKLVRVPEGGRKGASERLEAEARAMARLRHPHILPVHDVGADGDVVYVVMDFADGGSLADLLAARGPLAPADAIAYTLQLLAGLAGAHAEGIIHRDVKPQNVLLDRHGTALLADFGIALLAFEEHRSTRTGVAMGSLSFMAPEQRLDARGVGPTADLYATAATLYNLLTGGNPVDLWAAPRTSPRWAGLPDDVAAIIARAMKYDPTSRYPDVRTMALDLTDALARAGGEPLPALGPDVPRLFPEPSPLLQSTGGSPYHVPVAPNPEALQRAAVLLDTMLPKAPADQSTSTSAIAAGAGHGTFDLESLPPEARGPKPSWVVAGVGAAFLITAAWLLRPPESPPIEDTVPTAAAEAPAAAVTPAADAETPTEADAAAVAPDPEPLPAPAPPTATPAPRPALASPRTRPDDPTSGPPAGDWTGGFGGRSAQLELRGPPGALTGTMTIRWGANSVPTRVRGAYDSGERTLRLADVDVSDGTAGIYEAMLSQDDQVLAGTFTGTVSGRVVSFNLTRSTP